MMNKRILGLVIVSLAAGLLAAACGGSGKTSPTPNRAEVLSLDCQITEIASTGPVQAFRGEDRVPRGFDNINIAEFTSNKSL